MPQCLTHGHENMPDPNKAGGGNYVYFSSRGQFEFTDTSNILK